MMNSELSASTTTVAKYLQAFFFNTFSRWSWVVYIAVWPPTGRSLFMTFYCGVLTVE